MSELELLQEQRYQLAQMIEHAPIGAAMLDREMRYLMVNQRWLDEFAIERDIIGHSHYDVFPEIGRDWKDIHQRCMAGETHHEREVPFPRKDGTLMWLDRDIRPWRTCDGDIGGLLMYVEIITERKQAQDELAQQHYFLRRVIDLNTSFIFAKDQSGKFTLVNKALADAYGSTPGEMVGKIDEDFNPKQHETDRFRRDDLEVIQTRRSKFVPLEAVSNVATGEVRWYQTIKVPLVSADGQEVQLLGVATDITERKRAEDELRAQHHFLRQVIDLNTSFIFAKDAQGRFTLVNRALANVFGAPPEELIGKYDHDFNANREQTDSIRRDDLEVLSTRKPKFISQEAITNSVTGEVRWYQTIKIPLISDDGQTVQLLGVATDITERKLHEEQLQQLVDKEKEARHLAENASKMKDMFMANMSHELRTPLNAIIGFLREMIYSQNLDTDNIHMAERCLVNSKRLNMLINSVLDLSRIAVGSLELVVLPVNIRELAHDTQDDLLIQAKEKGLDFQLEIDEALPEIIHHDEERLFQIMSNLLVNAIKYTDAGYIRLALQKHNNNLLIEVSDSGIGIPDDRRVDIFENFTQLGNEVMNTGVGLGLAIVRDLVDLMGGSVSVSSQEGVYSVFAVILPLNLSTDHSEGVSERE